MKELPLSLTINGVTYYSQHHLATTQTAWYDRGKKEGFEEGKKANDKKPDYIPNEFDKGYSLGYQAAKLERKDTTYSDNVITRLNHAWYDEGYTKGYDDGYNDGYEQCKHDGISNKEIPGEYLSHMEEAYDDGYKEGYTDCREVAKMLNKYGRHEDGVAE